MISLRPSLYYPPRLRVLRFRQRAAWYTHLLWTFIERVPNIGSHSIAIRVYPPDADYLRHPLSHELISHEGELMEVAV